GDRQYEDDREPHPPLRGVDAPPRGLADHRRRGVCVQPGVRQGMSTAAIGAVTLGECLRRHGAGSLDGLAATFQKKLGKANSRAWLLATGEDYRYLEAEGPPPGRMTRLMHGYLDRVIAASVHSPAVRLRLMEVLHLIRSPASL